MIVTETLLRFIGAKRALPEQLIIVVAEDILSDLNDEESCLIGKHPVGKLSFHGIKLTCDRSMQEGGVQVGWKQ